MTNQEINEVVARKLGWIAPKDEPRIPHQGRPFETFKWHRGEEFVSKLPDYCTDIRAAWEIVEYWQKEGFVFDIRYEPLHENKWSVVGVGTVQADTAPMAIALAFLKLP